MGIFKRGTGSDIDEPSECRIAAVNMLGMQCAFARRPRCCWSTCAAVRTRGAGGAGTARRRHHLSHLALRAERRDPARHAFAVQPCRNRHPSRRQAICVRSHRHGALHAAGRLDRARRRWPLRGEAPHQRAHGRTGGAAARRARQFEGKPYDLYFEWSDERIYCSELVWKMYAALGVKLGTLQKLREFDLPIRWSRPRCASVTEAVCRWTNR